jgi:hypothetical protein
MVVVIEKPTELEAQQHYDIGGTSAESLKKWLIERGATNVVIEPRGHLSFVHVERNGRQLVFKNWWVVQTTYGALVSFSDQAFNERFVRYTPAQ